MKRVVIVRHAKSVPYGFDDDFNRALSERGEKDAAKISLELQQRGIKPDAIISSPAKRALKTAQIFAENLSFNKKQITVVKDIYNGISTLQFLELIHQLPETAQTVFFFGHNPGVHYFVDNLLMDFKGDMPTCSTVGIDFEVERWKDVELRTGKKAFHFVPKMF